MPEIIHPDPATDPATGLPEVPEGYFWRVRHFWEEFQTAPTLRVQLRRHKPWPLLPRRSVLVAQRQSVARDETTTIYINGRSRYAYGNPEAVPGAVRDLATLVYRDQWLALQQEAIRVALMGALDEVAGDYPPKVLA